MTVPFTYLVVHMPTGVAYYGVRYAEGCHPSDLWTTYFTSSKRIKHLIEKYGSDSFLFEIRKTFENKRDAVNWEHKVLRRLDLKNGSWLNSFVCSNINIVTPESAKIQATINWSSEEYRNNQIASQTKTWANTELRAAHSEMAKTKWNDDRRKTASEITTKQWENQDKLAIAKKISETRLKNSHSYKRKPSATYHISYANGYIHITNDIAKFAADIGTKRCTLWRAAKENRGVKTKDIISVTIK